MKILSLLNKHRIVISRNALSVLVLGLIVLLISPVLPNQVNAATGGLDSAFGADGKVLTDFFGDFDSANDVAIQADGKIIAAGTAFNAISMQDFALVRYNSDGSLDNSFGTSGKVTTDFFGSNDIISAIAIQADGRIIAVGVANINTTNPDFALARYNNDGSLDTTFGTGGKLTTDFSGNFDRANAIVIQSDGKIVAAGETQNNATLVDFALVRYNSNGSLDTSFGTSGKIATDFFGNTDGANAMALQTDGKIIATGSANNSQYFSLVRYNTDGSLDNGFGTGGKVITNFFGINAAFAIALQGNGKIVVAGVADVTLGVPDFGLARYNTDGSLDQTFGTGGTITTDFFGGFDVAADVVIQVDGKIIVSGLALDTTSKAVFALARYNSNGGLDTSFGTSGKLTVAFSGSADGLDMAIQADGKIVVAGGVDSGTSRDFALIRYNGTIGSTPIGIDVPVSLGDTMITFSNISVTGFTRVDPIEPFTIGEVPGGFAVSGSISYQITTTAVFSGPVLIAFVVPGPISESDFNNLSIYHNENGVLSDVTATSPPRNYASRTVYAITNSLSPFYLVLRGLHISTLFDQTKAYKSGSTVPIKLQLLNTSNANVSSSITVLTARSLKLIGGTTSVPVIDSGNANPDNNFRYDSTLGGRYIFNLSTKGLAPGRYSLSFYAGNNHSFFYTVKFEVK